MQSRTRLEVDTELVLSAIADEDLAKKIRILAEKPAERLRQHVYETDFSEGHLHEWTTSEIIT